MHEVSLCESIRNLIEDQARVSGFTQVNKVWLEIGAFSCVEPEALRFGFDAVMRGSVADGAVLEIETPAAEAKCPACRRISRIKQRYDMCPVCGLPGLELTSGDELKIKRLEVV